MSMRALWTAALLAAAGVQSAPAPAPREDAALNDACAALESARARFDGACDAAAIAAELARAFPGAAAASERTSEACAEFRRIALDGSASEEDRAAMLARLARWSSEALRIEDADAARRWWTEKYQRAQSAAAGLRAPVRSASEAVVAAALARGKSAIAVEQTLAKQLLESVAPGAEGPPRIADAFCEFAVRTAVELQRLRAAASAADAPPAAVEAARKLGVKIQIENKSWTLLIAQGRRRAQSLNASIDAHRTAGADVASADRRVAAALRGAPGAAEMEAQWAAARTQAMHLLARGAAAHRRSLESVEGANQSDDRTAAALAARLDAWAKAASADPAVGLAEWVRTVSLQLSEAHAALSAMEAARPAAVRARLAALRLWEGETGAAAAPRDRAERMRARAELASDRTLLGSIAMQLAALEQRARTLPAR